METTRKSEDIVAKIWKVALSIITKETGISEKDYKKFAEILGGQVSEVVELLEESDDGFEVDLAGVEANLKKIWEEIKNLPSIKDWILENIENEK